MDSYEIKTLVGVENYDKGKALFDKGCVGPLTDLGHHLSFAEIMDNKDCFIVTVRSYPTAHGWTINAQVITGDCTISNGEFVPK